MKREPRTLAEARAMGLLGRRRRSKYGNSITPRRVSTPAGVYEIRFDSKHEAEVYDILRLLWEAGELRLLLLQVPFRLPGGIRYRADFLIQEPDGWVRILDAKGCRTKEFIMKKKQVEDLYRVQIEEV